MDRAEKVSMNEFIELPAGIFDNVLAILETTTLELYASEIKHYAAVVSLLKDHELMLEELGFAE